MFFSNLLLYRLTQDLAKDLGIDGESLAHALKSKPARACGARTHYLRLHSSAGKR